MFCRDAERIYHEILKYSVGRARILATDCVLDASLAYGRNMRHSIAEVTNNRWAYMIVHSR
jgi:hypothetical protein